jgi:hypothetical protein
VTSTAGIPTGVVTFNDGATAIGSAPLNATGHAVLTTASLGAGSHGIVAVYGGDSNFGGSPSGAVPQAVNSAATGTALTAIPNPLLLGEALVLTASVTAVAPGAGTPTGAVTFRDGTATLATIPLNGSAQAVYTATGLALGTHSLTATYTGDANFTAGAPATWTQNVFAYVATGGSFAIGDGNAAIGAQVTFWSPQWEKTNTLSGGNAPASFKGFADSVTPNPPARGGTWSSDPANSSNPPAAVPSYMAVIVTSSAAKSGSTIGGTIAAIAIVKTDAGYDPNGTGTGTVVAVIAQ